jgi:hypothetical protein
VRRSRRRFRAVNPTRISAETRQPPQLRVTTPSHFFKCLSYHAKIRYSRSTKCFSHEIRVAPADKPPARSPLHNASARDTALALPSGSTNHKPPLSPAKLKPPLRAIFCLASAYAIFACRSFLFFPLLVGKRVCQLRLLASSETDPQLSARAVCFPSTLRYNRRLF